MFLIIIAEPVVYEDPINPCIPTPCGPNSQCSVHNSLPVCTCMPFYIGRAPSCRPECSVNTDCSSNMACLQLKCTNPCIGSCGLNAECSVTNHLPLCSCRKNLIGDPFVRCYEKPPCKDSF